METRKYQDIGETLGKFARDHCQGRIFAILEGGYNHKALGESTLAFCQGLQSKVMRWINWTESLKI